MNKNKKKKIRAGLKIGAAALFLTGAAVFLERLAKAVKEPENIDDDNPYLEPSYIGNGWDGADALMQEPDEPTAYERFGKRALDKVVSFCGLVLLAPLFGLIAVAIEIDDPGPVLFKQKRVGKDKRFFCKSTSPILKPLKVSSLICMASCQLSSKFFGERLL